MNRKLLRNDQWERIKDLLPGKKGDPGKTGGDNRLFIEAVLWIARTGSPWRDLLPAFGNWHSVYTRYSRWGKKGVWKRLLEQVSMILIWNNFSSIAQSFEFISMAQVQKKEGPQAIGRSRGGLTTKIHLAVDALGNPLRSILTAGQDSDIIQAPALIQGLDPDMVIADKAYDANDFIQMIQGMGAMVVIPVRSNRNQQREYDHHWYKDRNLVERFFNKIKQFRRIATRYEKLDRNFMSMLNLVCTIIWLA